MQFTPATGFIDIAFSLLAALHVIGGIVFVAMLWQWNRRRGEFRRLIQRRHARLRAWPRGW